MRVNLGSGKFPLWGYYNVDAHEPAHWRADVREVNFKGVSEVRMDHFLEHFGWRETKALLERIQAWVKPGGKIVIEVPDIEAIMEMGTANPDWQRYLYGSQQHEGEFHRRGFDADSLRTVLEEVGFEVSEVQRFRSEFPTRLGMPCLKVEATR